MRRDPTLIGVVQDVFGSTVTVELNDETATGLGFVEGEGYRIGQVGSFVRIPLGYIDLYGVVSQVGAGAAPESIPEKAYGNRWIKVQMVGEGQRGGRFERGISQHPTVEDRVHVVTQSDLAAIYGAIDPQDYVTVGHLASAESIPALVNVNRLVTRHCAVVGTTGSGKSTTVAGLLSALSDPVRYPASRILVLDIHGEYAKALRSRSNVFRVAAELSHGQKPLNIPFWALSFDEFVPLAFGRLGNDAQASVVADTIVQLKREALVTCPRSGVTEDSVTVDTPVPFCIHKLWFELHRREYHTLIPRPGDAVDEWDIAYVLDAAGQPADIGDAMALRPPQYRAVKTSGGPAERVQQGVGSIGIRSQLAALSSKIRDPRLAFLFNPGDWSPGLDGAVIKDIDDLLLDWIGSDKPVSVLDLSGIPSGILNDLIGAMLRVLYDAIFWARNLPEGGRERPLLVVLEEAHSYLSKQFDGPASAAVRRIAKEGRKYGVGMMLVSQRPSEIDSTILSQCGTIFALRLANESDRGHIASAAADNLKGLFEMLPVLRTGEAIVVGESVSLPIRALISPPPIDQRPDSIDPKVVIRATMDQGAPIFEGPGGWDQPAGVINYKIVARQWRKQSPHYAYVQGDVPAAANDNSVETEQ